MTNPSNAPALGQEQVEQISVYLSDIRRNTIDLAKYAYDIHSRHIQDNGKYDAAFRKWWNDYSLGGIFGSAANWSRWHQAGSAISKVDSRFSSHTTKLPTTLDALYAIAQLTDEELELCLENTYSRSEITSDRSKWKAPKKPKPVINPSSSAASIRGWVKKWRTPPQKAKSDPRRLVLATIKIHGSLFDFDKDGNATGKVTKKQVRKWAKQIRSLFARQASSVRVDVKDDELCAGWDKRQAQSAERAVKRKKLKEKSRKKS
jgi:hypothetical protein